MLVFTLAESTRDGRPWADGAWRPAVMPVEHAAAAVKTAMSDWALSTSDGELVSALSSQGATELRRAYVLSRALSGPAGNDGGAVPRVQPGGQPQARSIGGDGVSIQPLSAAQLDASAELLAEIHLRAYPAHHPDSGHSSAASVAAELRAMARGEILGPLLPQSRIAVAGDEIAGACLLVDRPGVAPRGGPWVVDLFRDPIVAVSGVGRALLFAVLAAAESAGLPSISLAVSHSNLRARQLYADAGFSAESPSSQSWTLALPPA